MRGVSPGAPPGYIPHLMREKERNIGTKQRKRSSIANVACSDYTALFRNTAELGNKPRKVADTLSTIAQGVTSMERMKVAQIAKKLGVSNQAIYQRLARLDPELTPHVAKEDKITFVDDEGVAILARMFSNSKAEPVIAASTVDQRVDSILEALKTELNHKQKVIDGLHETVNHLIAEHAESERRHDTIVMRLSTDIGSLQKQLEHREQEKAKVDEVLGKPIQPIKFWTPPQVVNPLAGKSWLERAYIYLFCPDQMRCHSEG